jgi:hypothetical protein
MFVIILHTREFVSPFQEMKLFIFLTFAYNPAGLHNSGTSKQALQKIYSPSLLNILGLFCNVSVAKIRQDDYEAYTICIVIGAINLISNVTV